MIDPEVEQHVVYRIANAQVLTYPFPHFYVEDIFPASFYEELLKSLPSLEEYRSIADSGRVTFDEEEEILG